MLRKDLTRKRLTEKHNLINYSIFLFKSKLLIGKRLLRNLFSPVRQFSDTKKLINEPIIAFSESELWNSFDKKENWILTAGKVENLRIATKKLNGIEIKANQVFSFWKHIGNPNLGKGYVIGREIREGCIVPTIGGGICQLSNALYDAALKANFDIIERHKHTKVIKGSLAEIDRDATVKWNYIDLQFKSNVDFRIEAALSSDKLIVSFKSREKNFKSIDHSIHFKKSDKLNDCYSCGNSACIKYPGRNSITQDIGTTTFILDEKWDEFDDYINLNVNKTDSFILTLKKSILIRSNRYYWKAIKFHKTNATTVQGVYRAIKLRYSPKQNNIFELNLQLDKKIAKATISKIPVEATHLVISQNLLPFIYETGALGGRTFDVLMTRLPIERLHERLDFAYSQNPESITLNDFRANSNLINLENKALTIARKIITPHSEIAEIFKFKVLKLNWQILIESNKKSIGKKILFPGSALGRKGAYEMKRVALELNLELVITGKTMKDFNFWENIKVEKFCGNFDDIGLVIYPTYVEHQPRQILKAISKGISVITTKACGIESSDKVKLVELGNFKQLKDEVEKWIVKNK